jgi:hypothetical protein
LSDIAEGDVVDFFKKTQAFTWRFQQDVFTYLRQLHDKGIALDHAMQCIAARKYYQTKQIKIYHDVAELWKKNSLKCPDCGQIMSLEHVNTQPGNQLPGGWKSIWRCTKIIECGYEELSKKSVLQWVKKLNLAYTRLNDPRPIMVPDEVHEEEIISMAPPKTKEVD